MLTDLGIPLLRWLDRDVLPEAANLVGNLHRYVKRWRFVLEGPERWPS